VKLHSRRKVIVTIVALIIAIVALIAYAARPETVNPIENIISTVQKPMSDFFTSVGHFFSSIPTYFVGVDETIKENEMLKNKITELEKKLLEYESLATENAHLHELLGIYETNPEFQYVMARVIGQDTVNPFYTLTINKGSNDGIEYLDPVVTENGLLGYVSQVGPTTARISTVLNAANSIGTVITRTGEYALLQGDFRLSEQGLCKLTMLPDGCDIIVGDYIETSGISDIYPRGLSVGKVTEVVSDSNGTSVYAAVAPIVDFEKVREIFVITGDTVAVS